MMMILTWQYLFLDSYDKARKRLIEAENNSDRQTAASDDGAQHTSKAKMVNVAYLLYR